MLRTDSVTADEPSFERDERVLENISICWCGVSVRLCAAPRACAVLLVGQGSPLCCSAAWCRHVPYGSRPVRQPAQLQCPLTEPSYSLSASAIAPVSVNANTRTLPACWIKIT